MNLHSNQIQFAGAEPVKVSYEHRSSHTADAVSALTDVVVKGLEAKAQVDDEIFASKMNTAMESGLKYIQDAKELNANYDQYGEVVMRDFTSMLESAPENVRNRFLRRNPTAVEDFGLRVDAAVSLKTKEQIYGRLSNEIPRLASDIVLAPAEEQEGKLRTAMSILQNPNLDIKQVDVLTNELQKQVDRGLIASAIGQKDWNTALTLIDNESVTRTVTPAERMHFKHNIEMGMKAEQEAEAKAEKEKLEGKDEASKKLESIIMETFNTLVAEDRLEDAKKFQAEFVSGDPLYSSTGAYLGDSSAFSKTQKMEISRQMNTSFNGSPSLDYFNASVQREYFDATRPILDDSGNPTNSKVDFIAYADAKAIYDSPAKFGALNESQQNTITKIVTGYTDMVTESLYPIDKFSQVQILRQRDYGDNRMTIKPLGNLTPMFMEQIAKRADLSGVSYSYTNEDGDKVVIKPRSKKLPSPERVEGNFYTATKEFNDRNILGIDIKPGTRSASVLYLAMGLAMNSHSVESSLTSAGAPQATANMLSDALIMHLGDLYRNAVFDSEDVTFETVQQDLDSLLYRINGRNRLPSDIEKVVQNGIKDIVLMGVKNPLEMEVIKFKNLEQAYPDRAIGSYLYAGQPRGEKQTKERDSAVKKFKDR